MKPKHIPAVTAIIVGADSDNTQDNSLGYVADISVATLTLEFLAIF